MTKALILPKTKEFVVPFDTGLRNIIGSDAKCFTRLDKRWMRLPHTTEITRLARNFGYLVQAPIVKQYEWPTNPTPFRTQKITAALLTMNPRAYVLSEMGTGKTRASLFAVDYLLQAGAIKNCLVVAPLSTLSQVWDREIYQYFNHLTTSTLHGTRKKRIKNLTAKADVYIINHDGIGTILQELIDKRFDCIIVDEVGAFRNKTTDRWKKLFALVKTAAYAWGMTGSPTPNEPVDAWGLAQLLTPARAPKYRKQFLQQTMTQITQFKWIAKPDANDRVYDMLQPAVRYRRDDCVELPEVSYQTHDIAPSKQVNDTYTTMMKQLRTAFAQGEITAANEGVLFMKLLQIACGWVYTTDRGIVELDNSARMQELLDIIEQASGKIIVFANFKHAAEGIHKKLSKAGVDCRLVTGDTGKAMRDSTFGDFQSSASPRVIVAHPQCMSHGLTLTEANTIVWFTPTVSLETYEQACARITRPGQKRKSLIIHLTGTPIENKIYRRLQSKAKVQGALLDMFNDN